MYVCMYVEILVAVNELGAANENHKPIELLSVAGL